MPRTSIVGLSAVLFGLAAAACSSSPSAYKSSVNNETQTQLVTTPFGMANAACVAEVDPTTVVTTSGLPPCPTPIVPGQNVNTSGAPLEELGGGATGGCGPSGGSGPLGDGGAETDGGATEDSSGDASAPIGENDAGPPGPASDASSPTNEDSGSAPTGPIVPNATVNGWVEYADWTATQTPGELATTWRVPDVPASNVGQTLFYFPSFEPAAGNAIVQPVLQYGVSAAGGGSYWAIASWWVGPSGAARYSSLLPVNSGDTIRGVITTTDCDANGGCKFVIKTYDETLDNSRQLTVVDTASYTWAQVGVFEVYGVTECNQLPETPVTFSSLVFNDENGSPLNAAWKAEYPVRVRNCPYQVSLGSEESSVTLGY
jgi:hypothetical protein